jgi:hypothetical protein
VTLYDDKYIHVPPDASRKACEEYRRQLDDTLNRIMYQVDHFFNYTDLNDPRDIEIPDPVPLPE